MDLDKIFKGFGPVRKNIDTDCIDSGGVEQGPEAENCFSEDSFQDLHIFATFLRRLFGSLVVSLPRDPRRCQAASEEV